MIKYEEINPYQVSIEWDENDELESVFNGWTIEQFIQAIRDECWEQLKANGECDPMKYDPSAINQKLKEEDYDYVGTLYTIANKLKND